MNKLILFGLLAICLMSICVEAQRKCPSGLEQRRICRAQCITTCGNAKNRKNCPGPTGKRCPIRCVCPRGRWLNERTRECVQLSECPNQ